MKVYELMSILKDMPSGANVVFHSLLEKKKIKTCSNDYSMFELYFNILTVEKTYDNNIILSN